MKNNSNFRFDGVDWYTDAWMSCGQTEIFRWQRWRPEKISKLLEQQIREFHPRLAAVADESDAKALKTAVADIEVEILPVWRRAPGSGGYL